MDKKNTSSSPKIYCTPIQKLLLPVFTPFNCVKSELEPYSCKCCGFKTNLLTRLKNHISMHKFKHKQARSLPSYVCHKCSFRTHSILMLTKHFTDSCEIRRLVKCDECSFQTANRRYLHRHKRYKHTPTEKIQWFQCGSCPHKTKWKGNLKGHIQSVHLNQRPEMVTCTECSYTTMWKKSLKSHMLSKHFLITSPKWIKCDFCLFKTLRNDSLKRHMKSLHNSEIQWLQCKICHIKTKRKDHLKRHMQEVHAIFDNKTENVEKAEQTEIFHFVECQLEDGENSDKITRVTQEVRWLECEICQIKLREEDLKVHIEKKHVFSDVAKNKNIGEKDSVHSEKKYADMEILRSLLKNPKKVIRHTAPEELEWFECEMCQYKTKNASNLSFHIEKSHSPIPKLKKNEDSKIANSPVSEDKWFNCDQCPFSAKLARSLKIHKQSHSRIDKGGSYDVYFKCSLCPLQTTRKDSLKRHIRERHVEWKKKLNGAKVSSEACLKSVEKDSFNQYWSKKRKEWEMERSKADENSSKKENENFRCDQCLFTTGWKNSLKMHNLLKHKKNNLFSDVESSS